MNKFLHLILILAGIFSVSEVFAQTDPTNPQVICEGDIKTYQVDYTEGGGAGTPGSTYTWSVPTAGFLGNITTNQGPSGSSNRIIIDWATTPPGPYVLEVLETNTGCPGLPVTLNVIVNPKITPTFSPIGPFCQNSTPTALPASSIEGISGTWSPAVINTSATGTSTYTFTPDAGQCALPTTVSITIDTEILPVLNPIGPLCLNSAPPALPASSSNGITGTWSPSVINTSSSGTSTYTFTPDAGQCAIAATLDITIDNSITPTFAAIGPLCENSTPPALPAASSNGITGTWTPNIINTTTLGTSTYTFTPDLGQCAVNTTLDITITPEILPTFNSIANLCENAIAPALPSTSNNGITGTWSPPNISTAIQGTYTYTFTPDAGQCAGTTTLDVIIDPIVATVLDPIGPLCQNSTAPVLPTTTSNGVTGTWLPATINTATTGSSTYVFTPDPGQCAGVASIDIQIDPIVIPTFNPFGSLCQNSVAPALPSSSSNGITGTWLPATINTTSTGTSTYTFTPDAGQCSQVTTVDITIDTDIVPVFNPIAPLCFNDAPPTLQGTSNNGITGVWSPAVVTTNTPGTTTYTFTPDAGQCAQVSTIDITVNPLPTVLASPDVPICLGQTVTISASGAVNYTWSPTIGLTPSTGSPVDASPPSTQTYTVTGIDANGCSNTDDVIVIVNPIPSTSPIFHD